MRTEQQGWSNMGEVCNASSLILGNQYQLNDWGKNIMTRSELINRLIFNTNDSRSFILHELKSTSFYTKSQSLSLKEEKRKTNEMEQIKKEDFCIS